MDTQTIISIFIPATIAVIMLSMGIGLTLDDFRLVKEKPRAVFIGAVSQLILLPLLGFLFAFTLAPSPEIAIGLVFVAICPGGPSSNLFTLLAGGDVPVSVSLTAISGFFTIVTIPLIANLAVNTFAAEGSTLDFPVLETAIRLVMFVGVPLVVGMTIRAKASTKIADRLEVIFRRAAVILLAILIIGAIAKSTKRLSVFGFAEIYPAILLNLVAIAMGFVMAKFSGLDIRQQIAIPIEVGTQNAAMAIALAVDSLKSDAIAFPAVVYGLFVYFTCLVMVWIGRRTLRAKGLPLQPTRTS